MAIVDANSVRWRKRDGSNREELYLPQDMQIDKVRAQAHGPLDAPAWQIEEPSSSLVDTLAPLVKAPPVQAPWPGQGVGDGGRPPKQRRGASQAQAAAAFAKKVRRMQNSLAEAEAILQSADDFGVRRPRVVRVAGPSGREEEDRQRGGEATPRGGGFHVARCYDCGEAVFVDSEVAEDFHRIAPEDARTCVQCRLDLCEEILAADFEADSELESGGWFRYRHSSELSR